MAPAAKTGTETLSWTIGGMDCASCAAKIRGAVERLPGVSDVRLSVMSETLTLALDESRTRRDAIEKRITGLGYTARPSHAPRAIAPEPETSCGCGHGREREAHGHEHGHDHAGCGEPAHAHDHEHARGHDRAHGEVAAHGPAAAGVSWYRTGKARLVLSTGALLAGAWLVRLAAPDAAHWVFIAACVIGVLPVARRAFTAAALGQPFTIEMLMTIAATGALVIGAAEEAALVVFLFAVGEVLEGVAADRARASIRALGDLVPKTALVEENGQIRQVDAAALKPGEIVLVRPGDRVPADGAITEGTSGVDESPVTGESVPRTRGVGDQVYAGSVNREAALRVRVEKAAQDNTIARIIRLVEEAQEARAPTERFIDRFSRLYMPAVVGLAILVALVPPLAFGGDWPVWIYRALALLLIGCPCALVISVPASIAAALSTGARQGLLLKGGVVIEAAARAGIVAFDKTGTLTEGQPRVTDILAFGRGEGEVVELALAVETGSSHPSRSPSSPAPGPTACRCGPLPTPRRSPARASRGSSTASPSSSARHATPGIGPVSMPRR